MRNDKDFRGTIERYIKSLGDNTFNSKDVCDATRIFSNRVLWNLWDLKRKGKIKIVSGSRKSKNIVYANVGVV